MPNFTPLDPRDVRIGHKRISRRAREPYYDIITVRDNNMSVRRRYRASVATRDSAGALPAFENQTSASPTKSTRSRGRPKLADALLAIDLFAGCGGLTLGLKQAGFRVVGAIEIDELAAETYEMNHPATRVWLKDVRRVGASEMRRELELEPGRLDLLAACPPCQGFSSLRTKNGGRQVPDARKDLVFEVLRFAEELIPKVIMVENVPGLARDARFLELTRTLERQGYELSSAILNTADYGVPQRRSRLLLLASSIGRIEHAEPGSRRRTVKGAIGRLPAPGGTGDALHDVGETRSSRVAELIGRIPKDGGSRSSLGDDDQLDCHQRTEGFNDVYGRMAWSEVAPTITTGFVNPSKGRFIHPEQDRAITLREAAALQTLPPNYKISLRRGKYPAAELIGNAFPPRFVKHHARVIRDQLLHSRESRNRT